MRPIKLIEQIVINTTRTAPHLIRSTKLPVSPVRQGS